LLREVSIIPKKLTLNEKYCKGCYLCVNICPKSVFEISETPSITGIFTPVIARREECIDYQNALQNKKFLCSLCVIICPDQALWWEEIK